MVKFKYSKSNAEAMNMTPALTLSLLAALILCLAAPGAASGGEKEIRQYQGKKLSPFHRDYDNSIRGPQHLDPAKYRLRIDGEVENPLELSYRQVLEMPHHQRLVTMPCVEGWSEDLLYEGVLLQDILDRARPGPDATYLVFHCADGYTTGLKLDYLREAGALLAFKINGLTLDAKRGFPFQLVVPHKLGYKWAKWITRLELTRARRLGYWEKRGYSDEADTDR